MTEKVKLYLAPPVHSDVSMHYTQSVVRLQTECYKKGIEFTLDSGYRIDNGDVDFEVLKAAEGDGKAVMSYTPHYLPEIPQSLFYATSKDGLDWKFSKERITEKDFSYLDPTGIPLDDKTYLLVISG